MSETLKEISGDVTLLVIAHRLATVRESDSVVYLESGQVRAIGVFDEVRAAVPDFDRQVALLGL